MRDLFRLMLGAVCALGIAVPAAAIPIVSIEPSVSTVLPGDAFSLAVVVTDVTDLYAFQFDVTFDPALLTVQSPTEGPFLATAGSTFFLPGIEDNTTGQLLFTAGSLLAAIPGATGSGTLAVLHFLAASVSSPQQALLALSNVVLLDSSLAVIDAATAQTALVEIVPEPASFLLLGSGLAIAWCLRRRR